MGLMDEIIAELQAKAEEKKAVEIHPEDNWDEKHTYPIVPGVYFYPIEEDRPIFSVGDTHFGYNEETSLLSKGYPEHDATHLAKNDYFNTASNASPLTRDSIKLMLKEIKNNWNKTIPEVGENILFTTFEDNKISNFARIQECIQKFPEYDWSKDLQQCYNELNPNFKWKVEKIVKENTYYVSVVMAAPIEYIQIKFNASDKGAEFKEIETIKPLTLDSFKVVCDQTSLSFGKIENIPESTTFDLQNDPLAMSWIKELKGNVPKPSKLLPLDSFRVMGNVHYGKPTTIQLPLLQPGQEITVVWGEDPKSNFAANDETLNEDKPMKYTDSVKISGIDATFDVANVFVSKTVLAMHIHQAPEALVKGAKFDSVTIAIDLLSWDSKTVEVTTLSHIMLMDVLDVMDEEENVKMLLFSFESKNTSYY
jgi:hypothetical protein